MKSTVVISRIITQKLIQNGRSWSAKTDKPAVLEGATIVTPRISASVWHKGLKKNYETHVMAFHH